MTIHDKKKQVLALLGTTTDSKIIEEVYDLLHSSETMDDLPINELPKQLKAKIDRAIDDYKSGNYITHEEMKQKLKQWLPQ